MTDTLVNDDIRSSTVRLIDSDGANKGIVPFRDALREAQSQGLDLVQVGNGDSPVCKILDFGKFKYEQSKKEKEQKKANRASAQDTHEIQIRPVTSAHDLTIKAKKVRDFLAEGDKVKVTVRFKGREISHLDSGRTALSTLLQLAGEHKIERTNMNESRDRIGMEMWAYLVK